MTTQPFVDQDDEKFTEQKLANFLSEEIKSAEKDWEPRRKFMDALYRDWRDIKQPLPKGPYGRDSANWSVPLSSTFSDGVIPRIIEGIFDFAAPIDVKAMSPEAAPFRDQVRKFIKWDIEAHPELRRNIWHFISFATALGTGFVKNVMTIEKDFDEEETEVYLDPEGNPILSEDGQPFEVTPERTQMFLQEGIQSQVEEVMIKRPRIVKYEPETLTIHYRDILWPKGYESIKDAFDNAWLAVKVRRTKDYLKKKLKGGKSELYRNLDKIKIKELEEKLNLADPSRKEELTRNFYKSKKIEYYEVYLNWDVDNDGLNEKIVALVHPESNLILGWERFPYRHKRCPIIEGKIKEMDFEPLGIGICEMLYDIKGLLDSEFNARTDRLRYEVNPVLLHTDSSGFNPKKHKKELGAHWLMDNIGSDAFRVLEMPNSERDSYQMEDRIRAYASRRTNVFDSTLGSLESSLPANRTATGVTSILSEGNIQFRHFMRYIILSITEIFKQRLMLYRQYWVEQMNSDASSLIKRILRSPDNPLDGTTLEALRNDVDIVITASSRDKELELRIAQTIMESTMSNPLMQQFPWKIRENMIEYYRRMGDVDPESRLPTKEEIANWQAEIQKMAMQKFDEQRKQERLKEAEEQAYAKQRLKLETMEEIKREFAGQQG